MATVTVTLTSASKVLVLGTATQSPGGSGGLPAVASLLPQQFDAVKIIQGLTLILDRNVKEDFLSQKLFQWCDSLIKASKKLIKDGVVEEATYRQLVIPRIDYLRREILYNPFKPQEMVKDAFYDGAWLWEGADFREWKALATPKTGVLQSPYDGEDLAVEPHDFANDIIAWVGQFESQNISQSGCKEADAKNEIIVLQRPLTNSQRETKIKEWIFKAGRVVTLAEKRGFEARLSELIALAKDEGQKTKENVAQLVQQGIENAAKQQATLNQSLANMEANQQAYQKLTDQRLTSLESSNRILIYSLHQSLQTLANQQIEIKKLKDTPPLVVINKIKKRLF